MKAANAKELTRPDYQQSAPIHPRLNALPPPNETTSTVTFYNNVDLKFESRIIDGLTVEFVV